MVADGLVDDRQVGAQRVILGLPESAAGTMTRQVRRDQLGRRGQMRPELREIGALAGEAMQGYGSHRKGGAHRRAVGMG